MPRHPDPVTRRQGEAGVTLMEILIVLAILGVMTGVAALSLPSATRTATLRQEADLLAARLGLAAEKSQVSGRPSRFDWSATGYAFREWDGTDWTVHRDAVLAE